jgi:hypothetical protein
MLEITNDHLSSYNHLPPLVSAALNITQKSCFQFQFETNTVLALVQSIDDYQSSGKVLFRSKEHGKTGFAELNMGLYEIFFQIENDRNISKFLSLVWSI